MAFQTLGCWTVASARWLIALSLIGGAAVPVVPVASSASPSQSKTAGPPPLYENLGSLHHPITTASRKAQRYFDQGLRLVYAFNHEEAIYSFEEAARLDPKAAMAFWGIALALGPNINAPRDKDQERRAYEAIRRAQTLAGEVGEREQAYIAALAVRYSPSPDAGGAALDRAYAEAMRALSARFPEDPDAAILFAEALMDLRPWDFWTKDGQAQPGTEEILATLEKVLAGHPDHPGACHFYIHAVEASSHPERALACARRLPQLMPGAGHLVHMPAHIYMRVGLYHEAAERNAQAAAVDEEYLDHRRLVGVYPTGYYLHNLHFLWASLLMEGRSREAIRVARELAAKVGRDQAGREREFWLEQFTVTPILSLVRFGRWDEVLRELAPSEVRLYARAMWHYARGLAFAAKGQFDRAEEERRRLAAGSEALFKDQTDSYKEAAPLLRIADKVVAGETAAWRGDAEEAVRLLEEAVRLEDRLRYMEPPDWYYPVRHSLGAVLLAAGRATEAEAVYREDLKRHPENGWALMGLVQSLKAGQAATETAAVETRFRQAWARADVPLHASRF
jgi:tetratricopeptide (TPR) repeat protein